MNKYNIGIKSNKGRVSKRTYLGIFVVFLILTAFIAPYAYNKFKTTYSPGQEYTQNGDYIDHNAHHS